LKMKGVGGRALDGTLRAEAGPRDVRRAARVERGVAGWRSLASRVVDLLRHSGSDVAWRRLSSSAAALAWTDLGATEHAESIQN
jgi:hypothetical protein